MHFYTYHQPASSSNQLAYGRTYPPIIGDINSPGSWFATGMEDSQCPGMSASREREQRPIYFTFSQKPNGDLRYSLLQLFQDIYSQAQFFRDLEMSSHIYVD